MANKNLGMFILVATLVAQATWVRGKTQHIVGDDKGWALGVDYVAWANGKQIAQGDELVFNYDVKGDFPVFYVKKEKFEGCCPMDPIMELANTGHNVVTLGGVGDYYFIPKGVDCRQGMKLHVNVKGCPALQEGRNAILT